jgi:hypothetical protein
LSILYENRLRADDEIMQYDKSGWPAADAAALAFLMKK